MILLEDTVSLETTFIDANVSPGILHVYYVKAINYAGISEKSNKAEVTPLASAQAAGTVANTPAAGRRPSAVQPWRAKRSRLTYRESKMRTV